MEMKMNRRGFLMGSSSLLAAGAVGGCRTFAGDGLARPTPEQVAWSEEELGMFFHFDIVTYAYGWNFRSWKNHPSPSIYNPAKLDTDQWMEAAKAMGAKYVVLVAKHCSGFLQWQTDLYDYGVRQSPWRNGKGDLMKMFCDSARRYGIKPGVYASTSANSWLGVDNPGLVNRGKGGDPEAQKRYNRICEKMYEELLTRYGELHEIWFDGGTLPPEKGGPDLLPLLQKHQPQAILFQGPADVRNAIRWVGNERGLAPYPCWSRINEPTAEGGDREKRFPGAFDGKLWIPAECDVPLRAGGFFWTPDNHTKIASDETLLDMYLRSVGRNCNLLLNASPDPDGLIPEPDMQALRRFGKNIRARFGTPLAETMGEGDSVTLTLPELRKVSYLSMKEDIAFGQRVRTFRLEGRFADGSWRPLGEGSCIGHRHIRPVEAAEPLSAVRLVVTGSSDLPLIRSFAAYA